MDPAIRRAIISVSDKTDLAPLARGLVEAGIEIYSTGGTRKFLEAEGMRVTDVASYTGFPEMMDGRLKTLHPKIFGGILCRHDRGDDMTALALHGISTLELVVVNLYPFERTIARAGTTRDEAIEQIDIGGPSLVRAAAKNHAFTTIATDPRQYEEILDEIRRHGHTTLALRQRLAGEAFARTADYDRAIADYFARMGGGCASGTAVSPATQPTFDPFPATLSLPLERVAELRYGENPHQRAALYQRVGAESGANLIEARQRNGKELSYNNLLDLDSAVQIVRSLDRPATSVIKHNNPCGAAVARTLVEATRKALAGDPVSAFGSVLGMNRAVDLATAELLAQPGLFVEAIVAPAYDPEALEVLTTRPKWKSNVRLMEVGPLDRPSDAWQFRHLDGGMLVQEADTAADRVEEWKVVTSREPDDRLRAELRFAWSIVRHVKSNAIVLCSDESLRGAGAGQMSRVDSVEIAIRKAGEHARGAVLASDAFFPFADSIQRAAQAGVAAIIQPGGSKNDDEVIAACNEHGLPMIFTHRRHFKH